MSIQVCLDVFEGPLDLLLHLVEKNQMNIYDISVSIVTEQYLEYMHQAEEQNLELTSEFLVMAATLLQIKSRMLLPAPPPLEEELEGDPREELITKLLEYKMYKELSHLLKERQEEGQKILYKASEYPGDLVEQSSTFAPEEILVHITLEKIHAAFQDVLKRSKAKIDPIRHNFGSITRELYTVEEKMQFIEELLMITPVIYFEELFYQQPDKIEMIVTFLGLLELIKLKKIKIEQTQAFDQIEIKRYK
ncbi:MAG: segregation/condensation protein A [Epulopiscium sp.]|nr:segregation/condensation protein A [Candidatus Epulonipiscium sp.]